MSLGRPPESAVPLMTAVDLPPPRFLSESENAAVRAGGGLSHWLMIWARVPGVVVVMVAWMVTWRESWR
jgi:hypothetical protein